MEPPPHQTTVHDERRDDGSYQKDGVMSRDSFTNGSVHRHRWGGRLRFAADICRVFTGMECASSWAMRASMHLRINLSNCAGERRNIKRGDETVRVRLSCCQTMRRSVASSCCLTCGKLRCRRCDAERSKTSSPACVQGFRQSSLRPADRRMRLRCPGREGQGTRIGDIII